MSQINVDNIKNRLGSGAPSFPNGIDVSAGVTTFTNGLNVGTGASLFSPASNVLTLGTNSEERVRIDADGNFNLVNTAGIMSAFKYETPALINNHFKSNSTSSGDYVRIYAGSGTGKWDIYGNAANLRFSDNDSAGNIQMDRPLVMNSQNIVMSSGNGIDFSATGDGSGTMSSELLDDYEEGTWDPVYNFSSSGDATTFGVGRYIKVGSLVHVQAYLYINGSGSLSGNALIAGLPYTSSSSPSQRTSGFVISQARAWPEDHVYLRLLLEPNSTAIKLFNNDTSSTSNTRLTNANFTAAAEKNILSFSGAYTV